MTGGTMRSVLFALVQRNRRLLAASSLYVGERLLASAVYLAVFVVIARTYSAADYGVWSYTLGVMQIAAAFLIGAAEPIVVRELVARRGEAGLVLGSAAGVIAATSLVAIVVPLAFLLLTHHDNPALLTIALLNALSFAFHFLLVTEHQLRASERPGPIILARLVSVWCGAGLKLGLAASGAPIQWLAWAIPVEVLLQIAVLRVALWRDRSLGVRWSFSKTEFRSLMHACLPAMFASVVITVFFRVNYLLLEALGDFQQVAYYAFSFNILQLATMVPSIAMTGIYPRLCAVHERDPERFREVVRWLYFGAAAFGYGGVAVVHLVGERLVGLTFGATYLPALPTLTAMFLGLAALTTATVRASVINILQAQRLHFASAVIGLVVLLPSSYVLIREWGAAGAAVAIALSSIASGTLSSFLFDRLRPHAWSQLQGLLLLTPLLRPAQAVR